MGAAFPFAATELERWRLAQRRRAPPGQVGAHLVRRRGASLEFRDHLRYVPGDDFRHIDWGASARLGDPAALLVRSFAAEERQTIAVSVDVRASMRLPEPAPKLDYALWLAEALARIALAEGHAVILHALFGEAAPVRLRGRRFGPAAARALRALAETPEAPRGPETLLPLLRPASTWVIATDLYFEDADQTFRRALARAQDGLREVILVDLDIWPAERAALAEGASRVEGPGRPAQEPLLLEPAAADLDAVETRIGAHKHALWYPARRAALAHDHWPFGQDDLAAPAEAFRRRFAASAALRRLFRRGA